MFDTRRNREDITDCDIIGEKQELVTNCDWLDRINKIIMIKVGFLWPISDHWPLISGP